MVMFVIVVSAMMFGYLSLRIWASRLDLGDA